MTAIRTVEMHTGGEPVRIVVSGAPEVTGADILAKRRDARDRLDHVRRLLMFEPRGHADMYGAWLVRPSLPGADLAVLFMHNEGYSTMCGHAVIALGRYAVDRGLVAASEPVTVVRIECPCGLVEASVAVKDGRAGAVSFESVPSFLAARDLSVTVPGLGEVVVDVAYGGAFYALVSDARLGLDIRQSPLRAIVDAGEAVAQAVAATGVAVHPEDADLSFIYGTIVTDGGDGKAAPSRNICIFAGRQVDRSPTGSGVTARMAAMVARGEAGLSEMRSFESLTGALFTGAAIRAGAMAGRATVSVRVAGEAHYCGEAVFEHEPGDAIGAGFHIG